MKYCIVCLLGVFMLSFARAQVGADEQQLMQAEEDLKKHAFDILNAGEPIDRFRADSFFVRGLVRALRTPNSFRYRFDSLSTISILYAPDSSFRIFTWQMMMKDMNHYRQKGAIQMRTADGSLKLTPLFDFSDYTEAPVDSVRSSQNWIGAVYYNIILKTHHNKKYYTLLGFDANNASSTRKWMEVLTFDVNGTPQFGGRYFNYRNDSIKPGQPAYRFCLEFKKDANAKLNYDPEMDMIVLAHLVSEVGDLKQKHTLVPYGTYEGFKWVGGRWVHQSNLPETDPSPAVNPDRRKRKQ